METIIKGIKTKNRVIFGNNHLNSTATGIVGSEKEGFAGLLDLTTAKRIQKLRPTIVSIQFNDIKGVEHVISELKSLRKKMKKCGIQPSPSDEYIRQLAKMVGEMLSVGDLLADLKSNVIPKNTDKTDTAK